MEVFLHDPGDLGGRFLHFAHHEKQLLRESFKVALKEIGKEKMIFVDFDFFIWTRSGMMIGIENHILGPIYTIPMTVGPYSTI